MPRPEMTALRGLVFFLVLGSLATVAAAADSVILKPKYAAPTDAYVEFDTDTLQKLTGPDGKPMEIKSRTIIGLLQKTTGKGKGVEINVTLDRLYGAMVFDGYMIHAHECGGPMDSLGRLSSGNELLVNPLLRQHDLVIATGKITPHYLAGFSGGLKALLPGCCGRDCIARNHALIARGAGGPGILEGNPIHAEMVEAAGRMPIGFILNVVPTPDERLAAVVAGHWEQAWLQGVELCRRVWTAQYPGPADCVVASAGGLPLDIDLYQLQRVLNNVAPAVRPGGTVVLVGECPEGVGQAGFGRWMERYSVDQILAMPEERITAEAHRAYATAGVMKHCRVAVVSSMDPVKLAKMGFLPFPTVQAALRHVAAECGKGYRCYAAPRANAILLEQSDETEQP